MSGTTWSWIDCAAAAYVTVASAAFAAPFAMVAMYLIGVR